MIKADAPNRASGFWLRFAIISSYELLGREYKSLPYQKGNVLTTPPPQVLHPSNPGESLSSNEILGKKIPQKPRIYYSYFNTVLN